MNDHLVARLQCDHRRCDALFEQAELHAANPDWDQALRALRRFERALEPHLAGTAEPRPPALQRDEAGA